MVDVRFLVWGDIMFAHGLLFSNSWWLAFSLDTMRIGLTTMIIDQTR